MASKRKAKRLCLRPSDRLFRIVAWCVDTTGCYAAAFYALAAILVLLAVAALVAPIPAAAAAQPSDSPQRATSE